MGFVSISTSSKMQSMKTSPISILCLLLFLLACGKDKGSSSKKTVPLIPEEMENILENQNFDCRSASGSCPEGIARLFILNPANPQTSAVCTGFLINEDTLVTNHHCVSGVSECRNTFISINSSSGPVKSKCLDIVYAEANSQIVTERAIDLTIMKISGPLPRSSFTMHERRRQPDTIVSAWVIDHVDLNRAYITELECDYVKKEASMVLEDCPAIQGNSGSPLVIRGTNEVIGILWGSTLPSAVDAEYPLEERRELPAISLATELFSFLGLINGSDSSLR